MILLNPRGVAFKGLHNAFSAVINTVKLLYELGFLPSHQGQF